MKKIWGYISAFLAGTILGLILMVELLKGKISNNTIDIKKPKMRNNTNSNQEFTSNIPDQIGQSKRRLFNLKRKKNGT